LETLAFWNRNKKTRHNLLYGEVVLEEDLEEDDISIGIGEKITNARKGLNEKIDRNKKELSQKLNANNELIDRNKEELSLKLNAIKDEMTKQNNELKQLILQK
jgi:hypothetical protein